jgi:hypothetical protein
LSRIVDLNDPQPSIVPSGAGGVQIEWHTLLADLEIEILPGGSMSVLFVDAVTGFEAEFDGATEEDLRDLVRRTHQPL